MTKTELKDTVKNGIFSVRWLKNDGTEGYVHRGILGLNKKVEGQPLEHNCSKSPTAFWSLTYSTSSLTSGDISTLLCVIRLFGISFYSNPS